VLFAEIVDKFLVEKERIGVDCSGGNECLFETGFSCTQMPQEFCRFPWRTEKRKQKELDETVGSKERAIQVYGERPIACVDSVHNEVRAALEALREIG
jgi:hypothetical protein